MIVVKIELHSAITREVTQLGQMVIANTGKGTRSRGNYTVKQARKDRLIVQSLPDGSLAYDEKAYLNPQRSGEVLDHARLAKPVWNLVFKALKALGHDK
jgi:hypothetical protein